MASAAEAEIGSLLINAQTSLALRVALTELDHLQPPTPIPTDNSMDSVFAASTVKQKRSKTIDMRYYWLQDRQAQKQIRVFWATKHAEFQIRHLFVMIVLLCFSNRGPTHSSRARRGRRKAKTYRDPDTKVKEKWNF